MKVYITIITSKGSSNVEMSPEEAVSYIQKYVELHTGWLYLDGNVANYKEINAQMLSDAGVITISNQIIGG